MWLFSPCRNETEISHLRCHRFIAYSLARGESHVTLRVIYNGNVHIIAQLNILKYLIFVSLAIARNLILQTIESRFRRKNASQRCINPAL